jgi:hypothetical protein
MTELRSSIDAVYDITLAYSSPPPNFWSYFSGEFIGDLLSEDVE